MERHKKRSVFSMDRLLNDNNDKAFKLAMFNGLAIILVILGLATLTGVYFILLPFIKPLLWALLCGSALHPFKQAIADRLRTQVTKLESSSRLIYLNIGLSPFKAVIKASNKLGDSVIVHSTSIAKFLSVLLILFVCYFYTPGFIWKLSTLFMAIIKCSLNTILDLFNNLFTVCSVAIAFMISLNFLWNKKNEKFFSLGSILLWISITAYIANFYYYLRMPVFVLLQCSIFGGYLYSLFTATAVSHPIEEQVSTTPKETNTSIIYIKWLAVICVGVLFMSLPTFLYVTIFLFSMYGIQTLCTTFGISEIFFTHVESLWQQISNWCYTRQNVLIPAPLRCTIQMLEKSQRKCLSIFEDYCDSAAAVIVILGLLVFGFFFSIFFTIQTYKEGVYLVQAGGSIINSTIVHNPEIQQMLPEDWQSTMDTALNNAYIYVRDHLAHLVRSFLSGKGLEQSKIEEIEKGALELWDRAYQAWVMPIQPAVGPVVTPDAVLASCYNFMERLKKTPEVVSWNSARALVQDNMSVLSSGLDSIWLILKGNMSLLLSILSTLFSILFGGGLSLINFIFNSVVFLTALFYLLSTSRTVYKPVEIITQMCPQYSNKLAFVIERSCQGVLAASLKLSIFYGLWTWLTHTLFMSNIIYMPSMFAAVLGVVPVLGTYWACLPAVLDLWLMQDSKTRAIGLFIAQIIPTTVVETTVYNEIKGSGHPYLTGLSIAGGLFWLGIEGAIAGPLILCFVFTIINMISDLDTTD